MTEPMRQLLRKETAWYWGVEQERAFQEVKEVLVSQSILAHYNPALPTIIAADASSTGIGAVLMQVQDDGKRRPISYASRSLAETEQRYAVIEKEALAATWACEKFSEYVLGLDFFFVSDHKPLVPLLSSKELAKLPARIQRFRLRMMRFSPRIQHVPGKLQVIADSLSRAPTGLPSEADLMFIGEVEAYAESILSTLPATEQRLQQVIRAQKADEICMKITEYCTTGWPAYMPHLPLLRPYWENRGHFAIVEDLLLYDDRLVIPQSMRLEILESIHQGHLGVSKCRARARISVWWPGMSKTIEEMFSAAIFRKFATTYGFAHTTSSPLYPQANGEAERAVRTIKGLLKKNSDSYLALLSYRSTPLQNGLSPSELLMGRRLRTQLPVLPSTLQPRSQQDLQKVREKEEMYRDNQQRNFNNRHNARELPTLQPGDNVWLRDQKRYGQIIERRSEPRSYLVKTMQGTVRRNRSALVSTTQPKDTAVSTQQEQVQPKTSTNHRYQQVQQPQVPAPQPASFRQLQQFQRLQPATTVKSQATPEPVTQMKTTQWQSSKAKSKIQ
ncbi:uncharacterized protein [Amphiura filiformis]|uniref:uncharacterized protein n=1 Tax=Amphiura filiformis TaxID=82378 RepID=UPI003B21B2A3